MNAMEQDACRLKTINLAFCQIDMVSVKRIFDLVAGSMLSFACCPVVALVVVAIRIKLGRPVIFSKKRIGLNDKAFQLYKFRTMMEARDSRAILLPDEQRLIAFGQFLRAGSLDERPRPA